MNLCFINIFLQSVLPNISGSTEKLFSLLYYLNLLMFIACWCSLYAICEYSESKRADADGFEAIFKKNLLLMS